MEHGCFDCVESGLPGRDGLVVAGFFGESEC